MSQDQHHLNHATWAAREGFTLKDRPVLTSWAYPATLGSGEGCPLRTVPPGLPAQSKRRWADAPPAAAEIVPLSRLSVLRPCGLYPTLHRVGRISRVRVEA
jgi:hypothetical protein